MFCKGVQTFEYKWIMPKNIQHFPNLLGLLIPFRKWLFTYLGNQTERAFPIVPKTTTNSVDHSRIYACGESCNPLLETLIIYYMVTKVDNIYCIIKIYLVDIKPYLYLSLSVYFSYLSLTHIHKTQIPQCLQPLWILQR